MRAGTAGDDDLGIAFAKTQMAAKPGLVASKRGDAAGDRDAAFETLVSLGIARVLTSGGPATASEGLDALAPDEFRLREPIWKFDSLVLDAGTGIRNSAGHKQVRTGRVPGLPKRAGGFQFQLRQQAAAQVPLAWLRFAGRGKCRFSRPARGPRRTALGLRLHAAGVSLGP